MSTKDSAAAEELRAQVAQFAWYHKIDLGHGVVTPGLAFDDLWASIRETRKHIDYVNKNVLDLASFDGMWAFEAEALGAGAVVATDCNYRAYANFLFCREKLGSNVIPYYNVSPYELTSRLDVHFEDIYGTQLPYHNLFEIVQHLGLLYHLRDPLLSLGQTRSVMRSGGCLLIETAAVPDERESYMVFNGVPPDAGRIYDDITTWWAPSILCLKEMLRACLFEIVEGTVQIVAQHDDIARVSLVAVAVGPETVPPDYLQELTREYRNPGLKIANINR